MTIEQPNRKSIDLWSARDVNYLREQQYATSDKLNARILLHSKYTTSKVDWFDWLHTNILWSAVRDALEVGCGTGLFWSALPDSVDKNLRITLTDLSPGMVDVSLSRTRELLTNVTGLEADVENLPFEDASFDLAIANQMLYHAPNPARALAELHRVLRPGGTLVASTNGPQHLQELFDIKAAVFGTNRSGTRADAFGSHTGRALLEQHFVDVEWRQFDDGLACSEVDDVVAYLTSTPPGEDATPEEVQRLRAETGQRMGRSGGVLKVTKDTGVFISRRAPTNSFS
ncbi:MAG TPA: class I SAM-dependent methyltransferase [Acidimicrobiales bacterium]|nr:class I SAM-dependent methyltransferase [Acidimicrobiales bacterium]